VKLFGLNVHVAMKENGIQIPIVELNLNSKFTFGLQFSNADKTFTIFTFYRLSIKQCQDDC